MSLFGWQQSSELLEKYEGQDGVGPQPHKRWHETLQRSECSSNCQQDFD